MKIETAYGRDLDDSMLEQLLYMETDAYAYYSSLDTEEKEFIIAAIPTESVKYFKRRTEKTLFLMKTNSSHGKKRLVGMACLRKMSKKCLCLHTVYIRPSSRRKGIGEAIVKKAIAEAKKLRCMLTLGVNPLNSPAVALYKKLGFKICKGQKLEMELDND